MIKPCRKCNALLTLASHEDNICPICKALEDSNMFRNFCQECQNYFTCSYPDKEYYCHACFLDLVNYKRSKEKQQAMNPTLFNKYMENHPNDPTKAPATKPATAESIWEGPANPAPEVPKSEILAPGVDQVPFEGIEAIGAIFAEGEIKYGRGNWKKQPDNDEYNRERCRHAIRHLMLWANGDRSENHIAKVAWFCVTTIWREKNASS